MKASEQIGEQDATRKYKTAYIGYAYMKNNNNPKVILGNSKEKMIALLQAWNKTRTPGFTYDICNVGTYNQDTGKYGDYQKINVQTGKQVDLIFLQIPKGIDQEKFNNLLSYLNKNGARYNKSKKQWYITEDIKDKFEEYLPDEAQQSEAVPQSTKTELFSNKISPIDFFDSVDVQYVVNLKNGESIRISQKEMLQMADAESISQLSAGRIVEVMEKKVDEYLQLHQLRQPEACNTGKQVTIYIPEYQEDLISGIKTITGIIQNESEESYFVLQGERLLEIEKANTYNKQQKDLMEKAVEKKLSAEKLNLLGSPNLSFEQMEQIFLGLEEGIHEFNVVLYADPKIPVWQMEVYRYGMSRGLSFYDVEDILKYQSETANDLEDSKNMIEKMIKAQRNLIIKDLRENKCRPENRLVEKIEKLNGLTGRKNSIKDILARSEVRCSSYKTSNALNDTYSQQVEDIQREIGKEIHYQQRLQLRASAVEQIPCR